MSSWIAITKYQLRRFVRSGSLEVTFPDGSTTLFGSNRVNTVRIAIKSEAWLRRILLDPELQLGEAYMEGGLILEAGDLYDLLDIFWTNLLADERPRASLPTFARKTFRQIAQLNPRARSARNVAHHYDIGNDFYRLFLDEDVQYSCAYFPDQDTSLAEAQRFKKDHIAGKLCLNPGHTVLDIGCGWGGLALHLAARESVRVLGVTLSCEQHCMARKRAEDSGVSDRVEFELLDYRNLTHRYDRIVSVGMFEHVGVPHYREYFEQVAACLKDNGLALIHTIGRPHGPGATNPWIARHIFPGGYIPALSEILPAIEKAGLMVLDVEVLRLHYAETLKAWRSRFLARRDEAEAMYDDRFVRMWDFYLVCSELSFRHGAHNVFQLQLAKRQDAAPLTRDYLYGRELATVPLGQMSATDSERRLANV
jgi:cyclopropane-fatty-acyl-phospholipid synthase